MYYKVQLGILIPMVTILNCYGAFFQDNVLGAARLVVIVAGGGDEYEAADRVGESFLLVR